MHEILEPADAAAGGADGLDVAAGATGRGIALGRDGKEMPHDRLVVRRIVGGEGLRRQASRSLIYHQFAARQTAISVADSRPRSENGKPRSRPRQAAPPMPNTK